MVRILSATRCGSGHADLSEISEPPRFFGQVQMVVMLSGPGYDFRQGIQRGVIQG